MESRIPGIKIRGGDGDRGSDVEAAVAGLDEVETRAGGDETRLRGKRSCNWLWGKWKRIERCWGELLTWVGEGAETSPEEDVDDDGADAMLFVAVVDVGVREAVMVPVPTQT
jgi:hypothetical protein